MCGALAAMLAVLAPVRSDELCERQDCCSQGSPRIDEARLAPVHLHLGTGKPRGDQHPSAFLFPRSAKFMAEAASYATAIKIRQLYTRLVPHSAADRPLVVTMPACGPPALVAQG
jgi:hypothetical protein